MPEFWGGNVNVARYRVSRESLNFREDDFRFYDGRMKKKFPENRNKKR